MVLFRPYERQSYLYYPEDKCQSYWVHFTGSDVDKILDYYKLPNDRNIFHSSTSPDYQWLFEQMIRELQLCRANYQDLLTMLLRHIFLLINRYLTESNHSGMNALDEIERSIRYFNEHYKGRIHFIQLAENNFDIVKAKVRYYALQLNYGVVIFDTLKIADSNRRNDSLAGWEELVQYSRDLDILAKKLNICMCCSVQLAQNQKGSLFLGSQML